MVSKVLKRLEHSGMEAYLFTCPGCHDQHMMPVAYESEYLKQCQAVRAGYQGTCWEFNGDMSKPTFSPSLLVRGTAPITSEQHARIMAGEKVDVPKYVCHSFIKEGNIQFLSDCTHELAGKTVPLEPVDG